MSAYTHPVARAVPQAVRQLVWFALVCTVAFFRPYLGVSVLAMQHDLFYLAYFAVTLALLTATCGSSSRRSGGLPPPLADGASASASSSRPSSSSTSSIPKMRRLGRTASTSCSSCSGAVSATASSTRSC